MGSQSVGEVNEIRRVIDLTTHFLSLPSDQVNAGLRRSLETAAEIAGAEHVRVIRESGYADGDALRVESADGGGQSTSPDWSHRAQSWPWSQGQLVEGGTVHVPDTSSVPAEAEPERGVWLANHVRAYLGIPLWADGAVIGVLEFERSVAASPWSSKTISLLALIAQAFSSVLQRRHAELAQQAGERRISMLSAHAKDAVVELSLDGTPLFMSQGVEALLGYTPEEMMSKPLLFGVHPDDVQVVQDQYMKILENGEPLAAVVRVYARDGSLRFIEGNGHVYETAGGERRLVAVARDVTKRESRHSELQARLEVETVIADLSRRFVGRSTGELGEAISDGLRSASMIAEADRCFLVSAPGDPAQPMHHYRWQAEGIPDRDLARSFANAQQFQWMVGKLARGQLVKITHLSDLPAEAAAEREMLSQRGTVSYLAIPVRADGGLIGTLGFEYLREPHVWEDRELSVLRLLAELFESALSRQRTEDARLLGDRAREARLAQEKRVADLSRYFLDLEPMQISKGIAEKLEVFAELGGANHVRMLAFGGEDGHAEVYDWNEGAGQAVHMPIDLAQEDHFPWAREQAYIGNTYQLETRDDLPPEATAEYRDMEARGVVSQLVMPLVVEQRYVCLLGIETTREKKVWSPEALTLLRLAGEIFASASRRYRATVELNDKQTQLIQSQKMEAVGTLAGGIAHDFNNQLAVMLGNTRFCLEDASSKDGELKAALEDIERAAQHCAELTAGLLAFSRHTPGDVRPIDTAQLIGDVRGLVVPLLPATIGLLVRTEPEMEPILGNSTQLQQVLINLVVNARDAMPEGGQLEVRAANHEYTEEEAAALGLSRAGAFLDISIRDDGMGMDELVASRIFEPFFTTKEVGRGTGLGLATAYGIVQQCGGAITVESTPGEGSVFRVVLPAAVEDEEEQALNDFEVSGGLTGLVLLVEDEPAVRRVLRRMLEARGLRVVDALNGEDALRVAEDLPKPPDVLVTDMTMPGMGGAELAKTLRETCPDMPVLFLSGYPDVAIEVEFKDMPATDFVQKPFGEKLLFNHLEALLDSSD
jgi:PAS domain S-box-containing protein